MSLSAAIETLEGLVAQLPSYPGEVRLDDDGIVIDNPGAKGAMTVQMMLELACCVSDLQQSKVPVIRIRSAGSDTFCSGGHLKQVRAGLIDPLSGAAMCAAMTVVLDALQGIPPIVIAAVDGPALGGGAELLTACDLAVAGQQARIGFVQAGLGVSTGWGGGRRLIQQVGQRAALRLLVTRRVLEPEQALRIGLVDWIAADAEADARERMLEITSGVPEAIQGMKAVCRGADEADVFSKLWGAEGHRRRSLPTADHR